MLGVTLSRPIANPAASSIRRIAAPFHVGIVQSYTCAAVDATSARDHRPRRPRLANRSGTKDSRGMDGGWPPTSSATSFPVTGAWVKAEHPVSGRDHRPLDPGCPPDHREPVGAQGPESQPRVLRVDPHARTESPGQPGPWPGIATDRERCGSRTARACHRSSGNPRAASEPRGAPEARSATLSRGAARRSCSCNRPRAGWGPRGRGGRPGMASTRRQPARPGPPRSAPPNRLSRSPSRARPR
jgi:hypothetical protein